jgi:LysM repeat protein
LLDPCPDRRNCWIYTVRSGDNIYSIANYFGHSEQTLYNWNPGLEGTALKAGRQIRMPPPTR